MMIAIHLNCLKYIQLGFHAEVINYAALPWSYLFGNKTLRLTLNHIT